MRMKTMMSAALLVLSGAAIAQVTTSSDPKFGNAPAGANNESGNETGAADNVADNASDPGKR